MSPQSPNLNHSALFGTHVKIWEGVEEMLHCVKTTIIINITYCRCKSNPQTSLIKCDWCQKSRQNFALFYPCKT